MKTNTIIDLKTTKYVKWQIKNKFIPKLEHILQLQCYDTMFSNIIPVKYLNILYVDMNDIIAFKVPRKNISNWIKSKIEYLDNFVINKITPPGQVTSLCKYCKYQSKCYNDGNGLISKPRSILRN